MLYEEMRLKKTGETVRVYDITDGVATIFDPSLYQRQNNGWAKVKASQVVPMDFPLNSKGYKVLDPHVKAIYGDSITVQRCEEIYKILEENGFACSNVALGVGSFSFQCIEEDGILKPFTRDTFSSCIKATYCEIDGVPTPIFKNPKDGGFKKSQKGCCVVHQINEAGDLVFEDGKTWEEASNDKENMLDTIFVDGKMTKEYTLAEVRAILHGGKF